VGIEVSADSAGAVSGALLSAVAGLCSWPRRPGAAIIVVACAEMTFLKPDIVRYLDRPDTGDRQ
jgi:hypothetical protein